MELIDTICHLDVPEFADDLQAVLDDARLHGVTRFILAGISSDGWPRMSKLASRHSDIHPAYGIHPQFIAGSVDNELVRLNAYLEGHQAVAVGEIGLDYFEKSADKQRQQQLFEGQLKIAAHHDLPVILHVRKAHEDVLRSLKTAHIKGGTAHAFNGSYQQATRYIDLGFKLGFGGMLTHERSRKLRELAVKLPLDAIVLESDAPDMAVASHRGERNSPAYLIEVATVLAEIKGCSVEEVARLTTENACNVFNLQPDRMR